MKDHYKDSKRLSMPAEAKAIWYRIDHGVKPENIRWFMFSADEVEDYPSIIRPLQQKGVKIKVDYDTQMLGIDYTIYDDNGNKIETVDVKCRPDNRYQDCYIELNEQGEPLSKADTTEFILANGQIKRIPTKNEKVMKYIKGVGVNMRNPSGRGVFCRPFLDMKFNTGFGISRKIVPACHGFTIGGKKKGKVYRIERGRNDIVCK